MTTPPRRPTKQAIEEALGYLKWAIREERGYAEMTPNDGCVSASAEMADRLASVVAWLEATEREG